jgi:drug/metabolite transporter (DMT)-like permease
MSVALSASGFWLYTIILFQGVKLTNGIIASLVIGLLPVTITLFSKPIVSKKLFLGLMLILLGLSFLLLFPLMDAKLFAATMTQLHMKGLIFLCIALVMWTWFAIANSAFLLKHVQMTSIDYSSGMGLLSLLFMLPIFAVTNGFHSIISSPYLTSFLIWSAVLGIGASWIANIFWAYCCKNCLPSVYGTLIVSETIFGLIYSFIFQQRLPYLNEIAAILLLIGGVIVTLQSQR